MQFKMIVFTKNDAKATIKNVTNAMTAIIMYKATLIAVFELKVKRRQQKTAAHFVLCFECVRKFDDTKYEIIVLWMIISADESIDEEVMSLVLESRPQF